MTRRISCSGKLIEHAPTSDIFTNPQRLETERYISGQMGRK